MGHPRNELWIENDLEPPQRRDIRRFRLVGPFSEGNIEQEIMGYVQKTLNYAPLRASEIARELVKSFFMKEGYACVVIVPPKLPE